ncbi:GntR family transcriptional regulator [Mycoplasma marinum]|uniref:HTH gntR-type domain-containing protein n=1 Tax=Mycoplasma marinum TaxID=1937190 RepID=A0A4R0XWK0_9MOLU|nr:GntR family transcriptional regulator [Mycoplasma marinum]TCG11361.1 hypothetical protein C4B24_02310 [Mycoplasma marinum]
MTTKNLKTKQDIIIDHIWSLYNEGSLTDGSFIPSERQLMIKFGFSRNTVRLAIAKLVSSNYLKPIQGKGYRIRNRIDNKFSSFENIFPGKKMTTEFFKIEKMKGFNKEAGIMDPVFIYKYRCADGIPFMLTIQAIPKEIWIRINQDFAKESLSSALKLLSETRPQYKMHATKKRLSLIATPEKAKKYLDSLEKDVVELKTRSISKKGIILEYSINYYNHTYFTHTWTEIASN